MSLKLECHLNWNVTKIRISLKWEYYSNCYVTHIGMSNCIITQIKMLLKYQCHSNRKVTQIGMSFKLECLLKWNVPEIELSLILEYH